MQGLSRFSTCVRLFVNGLESFDKDFLAPTSTITDIDRYRPTLTTALNNIDQHWPTLTNIDRRVMQIFPFISSAAQDACNSMIEYEIKPTLSPLAFLLPCLSTSSSETIVKDIDTAIKSSIAMVNSKISRRNAELYVDAMYLGVRPIPALCDPYGPGPGYKAVTCANNTATLDSFEKVIFWCLEMGMWHATVFDTQLTRDVTKKCFIS